MCCRRMGFLKPVANLVSLMRGPKYDGAFLHDKIKSLTRDMRVADTVTNIVVPAFDVKYLQPVIFTTYEAKADPLKNAHLSDICISTSEKESLSEKETKKRKERELKILHRNYGTVV